MSTLVYRSKLPSQSLHVASLRASYMRRLLAPVACGSFKRRIQKAALRTSFMEQTPHSSTYGVPVHAQLTSQPPRTLQVGSTNNTFGIQGMKDN